MNVLIRLDEMMAKVVKVIIAVLLFAIMTMLFIGVIARYFFNSPIFWIDELVTYMLVCMTFLGGYEALRSDRLVRVTFMLSVLPKKAAQAVEVFAQVAVMVFLSVIGYYAILILGTPVALKQSTVALGMPMYVFYVLIPIMIALMLMRMIINMYKLCRGMKGENAGVEETK